MRKVAIRVLSAVGILVSLAGIGIAVGLWVFAWDIAYLYNAPLITVYRIRQYAYLIVGAVALLAAVLTRRVGLINVVSVVALLCSFGIFFATPEARFIGELEANSLKPYRQRQWDMASSTVIWWDERHSAHTRQTTRWPIALEEGARIAGQKAAQLGRALLSLPYQKLFSMTPEEVMQHPERLEKLQEEAEEVMKKSISPGKPGASPKGQW